MNAVLIKPPFDEIHLIDLDGDKAANLQTMSEQFGNVHVHKEDCNHILETKIFQRCCFKDYTIAEAFRKRLIKVAGFKFVPKPLPMRNTKGATVYYLFFASANPTGAKIVEWIFNKYRNRGIEYGA